jgi:hypothetical protein
MSETHSCYIQRLQHAEEESAPEPPEQAPEKKPLQPKSLLSPNAAPFQRRNTYTYKYTKFACQRAEVAYSMCSAYLLLENQQHKIIFWLILCSLM